MEKNSTTLWGEARPSAVSDPATGYVGSFRISSGPPSFCALPALGLAHSWPSLALLFLPLCVVALRPLSLALVVILALSGRPLALGRIGPCQLFCLLVPSTFYQMESCSFMKLNVCRCEAYQLLVCLFLAPLRALLFLLLVLVGPLPPSLLLVVFWLSLGPLQTSGRDSDMTYLHTLNFRPETENTSTREKPHKRKGTNNETEKWSK